MARKTIEWLIIGGPIVTIEPGATGPRGASLVPSYAELLGRFGPGSFNGFVHLHPPEFVSTYGERLELADPVLHRHAVFADSENGDAVSWDLERGPKSSIYRFAPRSTKPVVVTSTADGFLEALAKTNLVLARGPVLPYFVPRRPRDLWVLRLFGKRSAPRAIEDWLKRLERDGLGMVLARDQRTDGISLSLYLPECAALIQLQHTGKNNEGWWQLALNAPRGSRKQTFDAFLSEAQAIGLDEGARLELAKAKKVDA